ncbi:effector-associated constant component EACC1 [Nocardia beijingensis]
MDQLFLSVSGTDDDVTAVRDLLDALVDDSDLGGAGLRIVADTPVPQAMGSNEIIRVVLEPALYASLSSCITAYLVGRKSRIKLRVHGRGGTAELDITGPVTQSQVAHVLEIAGKAAGEATEQ